MKTLIASAFTLITIGVMSCTNVHERVSPAPITTTAGAKGSGVDSPASPTTAPTTVLTGTGHIAAPIPSPTNNPITDAATVLPTSSWGLKFYVNGVEDLTFQNVPFKFNALLYNEYWHTLEADPHGGRMPVGFWDRLQADTPEAVGGIGMSFCSIDKAFYPLIGAWYLNSASTENNVILDKASGNGVQIRFVR
jgi:hypothetical protein